MISGPLGEGADDTLWIRLQEESQTLTGIADGSRSSCRGQQLGGELCTSRKPLSARAGHYGGVPDREFCFARLHLLSYQVNPEHSRFVAVTAG